jgi:hypothetical protein
MLSIIVSVSTLMPIGRSDMAKFSKKGWSSDTNYDNFSADGLERHVDKSRPVEELQVRLEDFKKGVNYHFHELLPDAAGKPPDSAGGRRT